MKTPQGAAWDSLAGSAALWYPAVRLIRCVVPGIGDRALVSGMFLGYRERAELAPSSAS